jgi:hypothetical protein
VAWWCSAHSAHSLTHSHTHVCLSLFHSLIQFSALHCECTQDSDQATSDTTAEAERAAPWSERRASRTHSLTHSLTHSAMHRRLQQLAGALQGVTPASPRRPLALATRSLTHSSIQCGNARQTLAASPPPTVPRHTITHSLASFSTSTSTSTPISTTLDLPDSSPIPSLAHSSVDHWAQQFFQRHPRPARRDLKYFLDAHLPEMRPENIMFFLYQAARRRVVMPAPLMQQLVTRLQAFPATLPEQQHITAHMIRNGFYGLRCYSIRHPVVGPAQSDTVTASWRIKKIPGEVLQYIQYLTDILLASPMRLSGSTVSVILHGVQGLGSSEETVRRLLHVVCHKLERSSKNSVFSSRELSTCFYSLRRMRPQDVEVLRLVRVLTAELKLVSTSHTSIFDL